MKNGTALVRSTRYMVLYILALGCAAMSCQMARAQRARRAQKLARAYDIIVCHSYADISINLAP